MKRALLLLALAMLSPTALAQYKVDDTGSRVLSPIIKMKWDSIVPQRGAVPTVSGSSQVFVRLNVKEWKGRSGRIFMTLPAQTFGEVQVRWTARQRLLSGNFVSGDRGGLVYAGSITSDTIEDTILLSLHTDGTRLDRLEQLEFSFRIDFDQP